MYTIIYKNIYIYIFNIGIVVSISVYFPYHLIKFLTLSPSKDLNLQTNKQQQEKLYSQITKDSPLT